MDAQLLDAAAISLRDAALDLVRDGQGVRVEDYLTALASATGEAVVVDAGLFDIEHTDLTPGAAVFGDALNVLLTGDAEAVASIDADSVVGILRDQLVPVTLPLDAFPPMGELYELVARHAGDDRPWGTAVSTVPTANQPRVLPIRMAFELRPVLAAVLAHVWPGPTDRPDHHTVCARALASAIGQTAGAIDAAIALRLALEVTFGMAKMVPMSVTAMDQVAREP